MSSQDESILVELNIHLRGRYNRKLKAVYWSRPKQGWIKLNTDGSSRGKPGKAGAGCILRDANGKRFFFSFWQWD
ncbi:hypothetical protein I3760_05G220100 [Carya illinoinensis]|nr:hypothetical protein I3760_05G220100 [Carya illinoinensis]